MPVTADNMNKLGNLENRDYDNTTFRKRNYYRCESNR